MIMSMYTGHKMISGNKRTRKQVENTKECITIILALT